MKKRLLVGVMGLVCLMGMAGLSSCSKEHQCKCVTTDVEDDGLLKYFVVAFEEHHDGSLQEVEVHKVSCRSYGD